MDDLEKYLNVLYDGQSGYVYAPIRLPGGDWKIQFFQWPEEQHGLDSWIRLNGMEHDVYVCPSIFREKSARKTAVKGAQVVWVEFDGQTKIDLQNLPKPNLTVQTSSETHQHILWRIPFSDQTVVEGINRRLTYGLEADYSGWDINQVLRPPMTKNFKYPNPLDVRLLSGAHRTYTDPKVFDKFVEPPPLKTVTDIATLPDPKDVFTARNLPAEIWQMMIQHVDIGGRSDHLFHLGCKLAERGLLHEEIVSIILVSDEIIGKFYDKDKPRPDRLLRLAEIASKAILKVQGEQQIAFYGAYELFNLQLSFNHVWGDLLTDRGSFLLAGEPGIGKTQLAFNVAASLGLGKSFLVGAIPERKRSLFVSLEMNELGCKYILAHQMVNLSVEEKMILNDQLIVAPIGRPANLMTIEGLVRQVKPDGVFIDTMSDVTEKSLSDEETAKKVSMWDNYIRDECACFLWWNHHTRKANAENKAPNKISDIHGSLNLTAKTETAMIMLGGKTETIRLYVVKNRFGQINKDGIEILRTPQLTFVLKNLPKEEAKEITIVDPKPGPTTEFEGKDFDL